MIGRRRVGPQPLWLCDVDRYPTSMFRGAVVRGRRSSGHVAGTFTFLGQPRDVSLDTAHHRFAWDPSREAAGTFLSVGVVDRAAWGLRPGPAHPAGARRRGPARPGERPRGATRPG